MNTTLLCFTFLYILFFLFSRPGDAGRFPFKESPPFKAEAECTPLLSTAEVYSIVSRPLNDVTTLSARRRVDSFSLSFLSLIALHTRRFLYFGIQVSFLPTTSLRLGGLRLNTRSPYTYSVLFNKRALPLRVRVRSASALRPTPRSTPPTPGTLAPLSSYLPFGPVS